MRFAILDLGTNTFHILIAEVDDKKNVQQLYRDEKWVFLAEKGIETITTTAIERAAEVLKKYSDIINQYKCEVVVAIGTAAFRKATNIDVLKEIANEMLGCEVNVIEGDREAELIYKGVRWACNIQNDICLLMDIGGGSIEFIIANGKEIFWKKSFPLGASILKQKFHHHEPILIEEINSMKEFLKNELQELEEELKKYSVTHLIGASGSFDSFASMIKNISGEINVSQTSYELNKEKLIFLFHKLYTLNWEERKSFSGLIEFRSQMIVAASIITEYVITSFNIKNITQSSYSLKEGVLSEMLE